MDRLGRPKQAVARAIRAGGSVILSYQTSESLPAELAPFLAEAREQLEAATDGLQPHEAIQHLESTMAEAEVEASRLGITIGQGGGLAGTAAGTGGDGETPVVVIRQMAEPG